MVPEIEDGRLGEPGKRREGRTEGRGCPREKVGCGRRLLRQKRSRGDAQEKVVINLDKLGESRSFRLGGRDKGRSAPKEARVGVERKGQ